MFKRKLFKRALPFILSVAMMFESLPATAMATESSGAEQMTETERQSEEGGEERSGSGSEESAEAASTEERLSEEASGNESGSESEEAPTSEESSGSESGSESEASTPSGSETPSTSEEWSESGSESETPSTSEESSGSEHEDEREEIEQKEVDAEETVNKKYETEIKISDNLGVNANKFGGDVEFERVLEGENAGYKFAAEYKDFVNLGAELVDALKGKDTTTGKNIIEIRVDDEVLEKDNLDHSIVERLEFTWKGRKADSTAEGAEAYTEAITTPTDAGRYMLTVTLPEITDLCQKRSVNIFVEIRPAKIGLGFDSMMSGGKLNVKPGTTIEKFVQQVTEDYNLRYTNKTSDAEFFIDKEKAVKKDSFKVTVHESNAEEETVLQPTDAFDASKEYYVHIELELNDAKNYELQKEDTYGVKVDSLQKTRVELETDKAAYSKVYDGNAADLAAIKAETKVFTLDDNNEDLEELKAADETVSLVEAGWYRREQADKTDWTTEDAISDTTVKYGKDSEGWLYVKLDEAPVNAGDYYVIWKYAGDEGKAYEPAVSKPVTYTVEHAPVVVTIAQEEADLGKMFFKGMDETEVKKALAQIDYRVNAIDEKGALTDLNAADSFFGAGYAADGESPATSYYRPTFKLQRSVSEEMKDGSMTKVEDKDRDWKDVEKIDILSDDDHKYEYRVILTGEKAIYNAGGEADNTVSITELSTASADQNHLVKVDDETLAKNAKVIPMAANEAEINTKPIVEEFNSKTNSKVKGKGTLEEPAVKIYDENALFTDRASYKKAEVYKKGTTESVENDQTVKTYTWKRTTLDDYKTNYLDKSKSEKENFDVAKDLHWSDITFDGFGSTDNEEGAFDSMVSNGLYELTISYTDKTGAYHAEDETVYFKVEQQQIVIVPGEQIAQDGQDKDEWLKGNSGNAGLDKTLYKAYKLPNNDWEEYKAATDKSALEIVLRENKKSDPVDLTQISFVVMNLEKGADGKEGTNYVDTMHKVFSQKTEANPDGFTYAVTARYGNTGSNYTSVKDINAENEWEKYHDDPSAIKFLGGQTLYPVINKEAVEKLTKFYDGKALTQADIEGLVTFYSDKEYKTPVSDILNTTSEYDPEKVNVYWQKGNKRFTTENVVWGGDYTLVLRFRGNEKYKPLSVTGEGDKDNGEKYAEWVLYDGKNNTEKYPFSIKRVPLTIAPVLKSETDIKAGDTVDTLLQKELFATGVLAEDEVYFQRTELAKAVLENYWEEKKDDSGNSLGWYEYNVVIDENKDIVPGLDDNKEFTFHYDDAKYTYNIGKDGGYPAFDGDPAFIFQQDDHDVIVKAADQYLRYGKKYTVSFEGSGLLSPLAESYEVTYLPASVEVKERGQGYVQTAPRTYTYVTSPSGETVPEFSVDGIVDLNETVLRSEYSKSGNGGTFSIIPRAAIKYYYENDNIKTNGKSFTGNLIAYRIFAPTEFEGVKNGKNDSSEAAVVGTWPNNAKGFIYEKAIEAAGGTVVSNDWKPAWNAQADAWGHYITVLLPVTAENPDASFQITWEDGYTDTFTLSNAVLEADLKKAVAPKSIKFNGVQTKMAVGETQQLDLKITKKQLGDVISIRYRIAGTADATNNDFISIDPETGVVTALHTAKKATTQIEAYPVCMENGKVTPITGKGVKTAKTKITVTNVTAPSIKKIVNRDTKADIYFTNAGNGYRREIYVVEAANQSAAKKMKAAQFESMIAGVKNGLYKDAGFALNPVLSYTTPDSNVRKNYDAKTKLIREEIGGWRSTGDTLETITNQLTPGKAYAVYVRNVSAPRTLDDGKQVDLAVNGSVKSFVATKSQVEDLIPHFNVDKETNTPGAKNTVKYLVTGYNEDGTEIFDPTGIKYQVDLSAKTAQIYVDGKFWDMEGGNDAAELKDRLRFALPLTKDKQARYQNPKLSYGIFDTDNFNAVWDSNTKKFVGTKSKYATISNKGKISLKGVDLDGSVTVYVYVVADNGESGKIALTIKADASTVTGKKGKLTVGQTKPLAEFLEYKNGKKKVPNYTSTGIVISDETIAAAAAAGYKIEDRWTDYSTTHHNEFLGWDTNDNPVWGDEIPGYDSIWKEEGADKAPTRHYWYITAVAPNKKAFTINFTDRKPDGTEMTVLKPVTLTSAAIQPVKSLKTAYVDDKNITINFKHAGNPQGYEIAVMDARKNVIEKRYVDGSEYDIVRSSAPDYMQKYQTWNLNSRDSIGHSLVYFEKTKTFAYTFSSEKLLRQSSYTISVTPVYEGQTPKTVSKKVKTTNIPAARWENVDTEPAGKGGTSINYRVRGKSTDIWTDTYIDENGDEQTDKYEQKWYSLQMSPYFQAGNIYTMTLDNVNTDSKDRVTDTLTWKSSNTKVATIKANKGTYTATFKPLKTGVTTISVTSKITKKVIARWDVKVKAIGDGDGFGGNYEPAGDDNDFYGDFLAVWDPFYEGRLEVLSASDALKLKMEAYDRAWVSFTAPTFGQYTFTAVGDKGGNANITLYDSKNGNAVNLNLNSDNKKYIAFLEAGQKVYLKVENDSNVDDFTLSVAGTNFARLTTANSTLDTAIKTSKDEWVAFTAPNDNYYTFITSSAKTPNFRKNNEYMDAKDYESKGSVKDNNGDSIGQGYGISLKAGETVFIRTNDAASLWVDCRVDGDSKTLTTSAPVNVELKENGLEELAKFTAPVVGTYNFKVVYDDGIDVKMYTASGNKDMIDEGFVSDITPFNAEGDTPAPETPKRPEKTVSVYMQGGEEVVFEFKTTKEKLPTEEKDGKTTYKSLKAELSVANAETKALKVGDEGTVEKKSETANTVKSFSFAIPADKNVKYVVSEGAAEVTYFDVKGRELTFTGAKNSFYVNANGEVVGITADKSQQKLKAGESTIYIQAVNKTGDDTKIKISVLKPEPLTAGTAVTPSMSDSNNELWYTFTAPKTGVYVFTREDEVKTDGKPAHTSTIAYGKTLFGAMTPIASGTPKVMNANETVAVKLAVGSIGDAEITTKVTLTVVERVPAKAGEGNTTVSEIAKTGDANAVYFRFTADADAAYTFSYKDADTVTVPSTVKLGTDLNNFSDDLGIKNLHAGDEIYIRVSANVEKASGTLSITKETKKFLESGKPETFEIKEDAANRTIVYTFTAAREDNTEYSVITTLAKDMAQPTITWKDADEKTRMSGSITTIPGAQTIILDKGQTITLEVKLATGVTNGTIKIQPTTPALDKAVKLDSKVEAKLGENGLYTYAVTEYGRYNFDFTKAENNNISITVYKNDLKGSELTGGTLLNKGDILYIVAKTSGASGDDQFAAQSGTLKIEKIAEKNIEADTSTEVTIANGKFAYFTFEAKDEHAVYDFETGMEASAEDKFVGSLVSVRNDKTNMEYPKSSLSAVTLDKGDKVFIKLTASRDNVQFKYTVKKTAVNVLKENTDGSATIAKDKAAQGVTFGFKVQNTGMYMFEISGENLTVGTISNTADWNKQHTGTKAENKGYYITRKFDKTNQWAQFTVTTSGTEKDTPVTVKVTRIVPEKLTADAAEVSKTINKGECVYYEFIPTATARYTFTTDNEHVVSPFEDCVIKKDEKAYNLIKLEVASSSPAENKSEAVKVKVTTVKSAKEITGSESFKKPAVGGVWYTFKADKNAKYDFTLTNGKDAEGEKEEYNGKLYMYKNINEDTKEPLTSQYMKSGDTILIKVDTANVSVAKDADLKLVVTPKEVDQFDEIIFKIGSGLDKNVSFNIKKDEKYTIYAYNKGTTGASVKAATVEYKDKDGKPQSETFESGYRFDPEVLGLEADTKITIRYVLTEEAKDADYQIFVVKDEKPKNETTE